MRPTRYRHWKTRTWRAAPEPGRSLLTKARRRTLRRAGARFSPLRPRRPEPELTPLAKIPTLAGWLAARERLPADISRERARAAG